MGVPHDGGAGILKLFNGWPRWFLGIRLGSTGSPAYVTFGLLRKKLV